LIASICECIILNWKIDKEYPWLKTDKGQGKDLNKKYPQILKSTKQIFIHKIKDFLLTQSDQIFIFAFVSLKMVAYYGNYTVIIAKTSQLFNTTLDSFGAGVGNLVAEGDPNRINKVFWELMSIRYFVGGIIAFSLYYLINPFITVWLGGQYVLGHVILILMIINCFIMQTRGVVDMFNHAYGHYADVWSAWAEGGINITITIIAGYFWGIAGILLGKIMSLFIIVVLWKPYYLFTCGFKKSIKLYWREVLKYLLVFTCTFVIMSLLIPHIKIAPQSGFIQWGFFAIAIVSLFILFYALGLLALCQGARSALCRIPIVNRIKRK
jgi:O-antigen/teichoic acid export membrane protein